MLRDLETTISGIVEGMEKENLEPWLLLEDHHVEKEWIVLPKLATKASEGTKASEWDKVPLSIMN